MSEDHLSLKGSMFPLTILELEHTNLAALQSALTQKIAAAPDFFLGTAVVADCSDLQDTAETPIDFLQLKNLIDETGMFLVGLSGLDTPALKQSAKLANLPEFKQIGKKRQISTPEPEKTPAQPVEATPTIIEKEVVKVIESGYQSPDVVNGNIRSGQRHYAEGRDLVIFGNVSPGAEVISDGNIYIYGKLHGRALAGAQGNVDAIVCASHLKAQLVSIAGYYKVLEDVKEYADKGAIKIQLDNTALQFHKIDLL